MISIAFVIDTIESPTAGTEKQLLLLLKHLNREKFRPYLCVLRSSPWLREEFAEAELFDAEIPSFLQLSTPFKLWRLVRFFREKNIDIVQTHFRDGSIAGVVAARLARVKAIVGTRRNQGYWYTPMEKRLQTMLTRWVSSVIVNSESTRQMVLETEDVRREQIFVIYNAVDVGPFKKVTSDDRLEAREELGIPTLAPVVGIVANLRPVKGLSVFIRAAALIREQVKEVRFVIVGEGNEQQVLMLLAAELGIREAVTFTGRRTDVPRLLKAFDVGVLSSYSESFSNSIVEYLVSGLPVVSTDVGGCSECIREGVNGFVVPVGDHEELARGVVAVLGMEWENRSAERIRVALDQFSLEQSVISHQKLYEDLFSKC